MAAYRQEALGWLASIGADHAVPANMDTKLPTLSDEQWLRLQPQSGRPAIAAKQAAAKPKEIALKPKEAASKPQETAPNKAKDTAPKPKGRPRYDIVPHQTIEVAIIIHICAVQYAKCALSCLAYVVAKIIKL